MREVILIELEAMFEKAEKEELWFYSYYQNLWFSPKELRRKHKEGKFVWGITNWTLRNPSEKIAELEQSKRTINKEIENIKSRIEGEQL